MVSGRQNPKEKVTKPWRNPAFMIKRRLASFTTNLGPGSDVRRRSHLRPFLQRKASAWPVTDFLTAFHKGYGFTKRAQHRNRHVRLTST